MRTTGSILVILFLTIAGLNSSAQTSGKPSGQLRTETFKVWGNCNMCKDRIESAVKAEGATNAAWDSKTKMLALSFDPAKTSLDALSKKLALAGHDTEKYKATDAAYEKLPGCCHYDRTK
jgi:periplasmic mercuric ion binding protein